MVIRTCRFFWFFIFVIANLFILHLGVSRETCNCSWNSLDMTAILWAHWFLFKFYKVSWVYHVIITFVTLKFFVKYCLPRNVSKQDHLQISASDLEKLLPDTTDELFLPQLFHFGRQLIRIGSCWPVVLWRPTPCIKYLCIVTLPLVSPLIRSWEKDSMRRFVDDMLIWPGFISKVLKKWVNDLGILPFALLEPPLVVAMVNQEGCSHSLGYHDEGL